MQEEGLISSTVMRYKKEPEEVFLRACFSLPVKYTPIWIMRQAGRYLPEYQAIRRKVEFLELCKTPDLAAEVTLQPIERLGVDAAILFSDILIPCEAMGLDLEFIEGTGPVLSPVRTDSDADRLIVPDPSDKTGFVADAVREIRKQLDGRFPLIGFSGAPFTLATYMIEGGASKNFINLKKMIFSEPALYRKILDKITETSSLYLASQIEAGAQAVQIFDSWGGALSVPDFEEYALPYVQRIVESLPREGIPVIYYVGHAAHLIESMLKSGADVLGIDWRLPISSARQRIGGLAAVQGNLDPASLFGSVKSIRRKVLDILEGAGESPGHVFNLGHGILPPTDPDHARALVDAVHEFSRKK